MNRVQSVRSYQSKDMMAALNSRNGLPIETGEDERLGNKRPITTILVLAFGPLISESVLVLQSLLTSLFVSHTIGSLGMEVLGAIYAIEFITIALSRYLLDSVELKFSNIFGEGRVEDLDQLFVDFVRVCMVMGILIPCIILPVTGPLVQLLGAPKELSKHCLEYMFPETVGSIGNLLFMTCCGVIESEGRSYLFGIIQFASFCFIMLLNYLFLYVGRCGIWAASTAIITSQAVFGFVLTIVIFMGKLTIHPKMSMFVKKPSPDLWPGLAMGLSNLVAQLSQVIPTLLMQFFFFRAARNIGVYDIVSQTWAATERMNEVIACICNGFTNAFAPAASYAFGAKRMNRIFWLLFHMLWMATLIAAIVSGALIIWPKQIGRIWSSDHDFLYWLSQTMPKVFYAITLIPVAFAVPALLAACHLITRSVVLAILILIFPYPIAAGLLYWSDPNDPARVMYTYMVADIFAGIVGIIGCWKELKECWLAPDDKIAAKKRPEQSSASATSMTWYTEGLLDVA